jgi:predicted ArsR family transcriptional regulator
MSDPVDPDDPGAAPPAASATLARLDVLKALGDNTRYAIYLELARSPRPRSTGEVADTLELHPNTVRPHLERMRDVGLLSVETESRGVVGRPQHRWSLAADAPALGLEPPAMPLLAGLLGDVAAAAGAGGEEAVDAGRSRGRAAAEAAPVAVSCLDALIDDLDRLGFDPAVATDDAGTTVAFGHCPFASLVASHPQLACNLHRGMVEGFVELGGELVVGEFHDVADRLPCRVDLVAR